MHLAGVLIEVASTETNRRLSRGVSNDGEVLVWKFPGHLREQARLSAGMEWSWTLPLGRSRPAAGRRSPGCTTVVQEIMKCVVSNRYLFAGSILCASITAVCTTPSFEFGVELASQAALSRRFCSSVRWTSTSSFRTCPETFWRSVCGFLLTRTSSRTKPSFSTTGSSRRSGIKISCC